MLSRDRIDKIYQRTGKGEIFLPIGHYALITPKEIVNNDPLTIIISGLGSCIALIMRDLQKNVHGMSHILLPTMKSTKNPKNKDYPHKYAVFSVKELFNELIINGAEKRNIKAAILGGADIFRNGIYAIGKENISKVREELKKLEIEIECEEIGGHRGRVAKYDIKNNLILTKFTGEDDFRILNKKGVKITK